jgi:hypothetical protein
MVTDVRQVDHVLLVEYIPECLEQVLVADLFQFFRLVAAVQELARYFVVILLYCLPQFQQGIQGGRQGLDALGVRLLLFFHDLVTFLAGLQDFPGRHVRFSCLLGQGWRRNRKENENQ